MSGEKKKEIFFHVGLGKTGTTFLQYRVFPKLQGLHYIQRTKFKNAVEIIHGLNASKILVSREFDQQLEDETTKFSRAFPHAHPIIVLRRQDEYIASQYRRFVKNGFSGSFTDFFDLKKDEGRFVQKDLRFVEQIELLDKLFEPKPIVLLYDELRSNPQQFVTDFAERMGASIEVSQVNFAKKHRSYSEKQLKVFRRMAGKYNLQKRRLSRNPLINIPWRIYMSIVRYGTLYAANLVSDEKLPAGPLIPKEELEKVRAFYADDWARCLEIAGE